MRSCAKDDSRDFLKKGYTMEDIRKQQIEALETIVEYVPKLAKAFETIAAELKGEKAPDTDEFLKQAVDGLNFVIEMFNVTVALLNEKEELFQKDVIEEKVKAFDQAYQDKDDAKIAEAIEDGIIPFIEIYAEISKVFLSKENA